jgi:hypothetical protein
MATAGIGYSLLGVWLGVIGEIGRGSSLSKRCANCWHAHPFIKSSHITRFCSQFLLDILAAENSPIWSRQKNHPPLLN